LPSFSILPPSCPRLRRRVPRPLLAERLVESMAEPPIGLRPRCGQARRAAARPHQPREPAPVTGAALEHGTLAFRHQRTSLAPGGPSRGSAAGVRPALNEV